MAVGCFTLAMAMQAFSQAGYLANMQDIAPRYAGRLFGLANTAGSLAGVVGTAAVGIIVERTGSWTPVFQTMVRFPRLRTISAVRLLTGCSQCFRCIRRQFPLRC